MSADEGMHDDLDDLLRSMPFERGRPLSRLATARDGRAVLLVRIELGVLQMEIEGRPDGLPSVLTRVVSVETLAADDALAAAVRLELVQHQQRAIALAAAALPARALADWERVVAGADLLVRAGGSQAEWAAGVGFSALVARTRLVAAVAISEGRPRDAATAISDGLVALRERAALAGLGDSFEDLGDVAALRAWRASLVPSLPPAQRAELEGRLRAAIAAENYELAAILRDELRLL